MENEQKRVWLELFACNTNSQIIEGMSKNLDVEGFMEISLKYFSKAYDKIFIQSSQIATCMTL